MTKKKLVDDSERMIPEAHNRTIMYAEHMTRYTAALSLVKDKVVLDIASGSGYGTKMLGEVAKKVYGVDVSVDAIEYAKENYGNKNIEYTEGSAENIPLPDNSVDIVISFETLEHVKNYRKFLDEIKRVMKKDGLAVISTPNKDEFAEGNHFHLHEFKLSELKGLLQDRFKNLKDYHQATWAYVQISDPDFLGTDGVHRKVDVYNYSPVTPRQYLYFYFLCSNRTITESIKDVGGLGGHYSSRELGDIFAHYQKQISDHKIVLENEKEAHRHTEIKLRMREGENHAITQSTSYRIAKKLALAKSVVATQKQRVRSLHPKRAYATTQNRRYVMNSYASSQFTNAFKAQPTSKTAIVLHLHYIDMLPYFSDKLSRLKDNDYDLYITLSDQNSDKIDLVLNSLPDARIAVVPNCGRDVLPFVQVMKRIMPKKYTRVLKIHSKKSPHRPDGDEWRDNLIDNLLPATQKELDKIYELLDKKETGMVGPAGEYVSFLVNLEATSHHIDRFLRKIYSQSSVDTLMRNPNEYGFFGGTMFWVNPSRLKKIIDVIDPAEFELELGQQDSTFAHALERIFCIAMEIESKSNYEKDKGDIHEIGYATTNIPKWSAFSIE